MIKARANSWIWLLGLALAVPIEAAWAQAQKASLAVRVTSKATGQPIRNSLCVVESNLDTGSSGIKLTNTSGVCVFPVLRPGIYTLRVDARDFKPEAVARVVVGSSGVEVKVALEPFKTSGPAAIECKKKLEEADIVALLKGGVHEGRVLEFVRSCGVSFALDAPLEQRLRAAGATEVLVDWLRPPKTPPAEDPLLRDRNFWAVILGVSKFAHLPPDQPLNFADRDAEAFAKFIGSRRGKAFPEGNIKLLLNEAAPVGTVRRNLATWLPRNARPNDVVYIFLASHGMVEADAAKATYILGFDADPDDLHTTAIPMKELADIFSNRLGKAGRIVLLADLAHSAMGADVLHSLQQAASKNREVIGLMASRRGEISQAGPQFCGGHGAFTCFLLKGLSGAADHDKDNIVSLSELISYMSEQIPRATENKQHLHNFGNFDHDVPLSYVDKPGPADWKAFAPGPK